ncbi:MAG: ABC transporter ATP-binding protein [Nitrospirae bacterium]|nr:MAG: ABC transporter ATP-binding protein [Nitrospirota bacterium]
MMESGIEQTLKPVGFQILKQTQPSVEVKNISKKFCKHLKLNMFYGLVDLTKNLVGIRPDTTTLRKGEFWALKDVSFTLRKGQVLGVIGTNGSGKTTLLRIVSGIFPPDTGEVRLRGRASALISLGAGFHPHMTGLENIYINGSILGMSKKEIDKKLDGIIDFSELGEFIDAPVSTYSSGMKVRLGFSIAIAVQPDILFLDEILAVGDRNFKAKCYKEIDKLSSNTAIVFVSHFMHKIARVCTDILVLDNGKVVYYGDDVAEGIDYYYSYAVSDDQSVTGEGMVSIEDIFFRKEDGASQENGTFTIEHGSNFTLGFKLYPSGDNKPLRLLITFHDRDFVNVATTDSLVCGCEIRSDASPRDIRVYFEDFPLTPGRYSMSINIEETDSKNTLKVYHNIKDLNVTGKFRSRSPVSLRTRWEASQSA